MARSFDSAGPYDRLIAIYTAQARHRDVERVAAAALTKVRTHQQKREFYEHVRQEARKQATKLPQAAAKRR